MTTPKHSFRIENELIRQAQARAITSGRTLSSIIRELLWAYVRGELDTTVHYKQGGKR